MSELFTAKDARVAAHNNDHDILIRALELL
jgi:hypothetical protein